MAEYIPKIKRSIKETGGKCAQTGTPSGFDGFFRFTASALAGSAAVITARKWVILAPRQSSVV
jgi:hypothetical protein